MTLIQCEACETGKKKKRAVWIIEIMRKNKHLGKGYNGFDTSVLASEHVLAKGQQENTK